MSNYRIKFVIDEDASFEECNGEPRPLTRAEYAENVYRACPKHPRSKLPPQRVDGGRAWCGECGAEYVDIPYDEYLAYYGNPDRHVYLGAIVEKQCGECKTWTQTASLWRIDVMDDDPAYLRTPLDTWMPIDAPLEGYFAQVRDELYDEALIDA